MRAHIIGLKYDKSLSLETQDAKNAQSKENTGTLFSMIGSDGRRYCWYECGRLSQLVMLINLLSQWLNWAIIPPLRPVIDRAPVQLSPGPLQATTSNLLTYTVRSGQLSLLP